MKLSFLNLNAVMLLFSASTVAFSQNTTPNEIAVTYNKTTSIVFPYSIRAVDRGSSDVMAQKVNGVENVLQIKAAQKDFEETNVTVITADGILHQFNVNYSDNPSSYALYVPKKGNENSSDCILIFTEGINYVELLKISEKISKSFKTGKLISAAKNKVQLSLKGVYIKEDMAFYHLEIDNRSNINYDIESLRFYIRDQKKFKRTATQEVEIKPMYVFGETETVKGKSTAKVIYSIKKFTIPDAKHLVIEILEKDGARNLELTIKNKTIVNARAIPVK